MINNKILIITAGALSITFIVLSINLYFDHNEYNDINDPMPTVDVTEQQKELKRSFEVKELVYNEDSMSIYRYESEFDSCVDIITEKRFTQICEQK